MKIDLLYELQMPKPWPKPQSRGEYQVYRKSMAQIELADKLGFDTVWLVEHHFREERSHSSAPEIFLGAVAQRTQNIRLGHGVVLLPYPFNHPVRVAERAAVLDLLSNGRVEFGTGRSTRFEQEGFRIKYEESRAMWKEAMEIIPQMWMKERFSHKGQYFDIPERNVVPKPLQEPHPPLWMAASNDESYPIAAEIGVGALGLTILLPLDRLEQRINVYRRGIKNAKPVGAMINDKVGAYTLVMCADSAAKAREAGAYEAVAWWLTHAVLATTAWEGMQSTNKMFGDFPLLQKYHEGKVGVEAFDHEDMVVIGDPDHVIRKMESYAKTGVDHILCDVDFGHMKHEDIIHSIELLGKYVIPHFKRKGISTTIGAQKS
ncbi:MAG: LLM class flavin-dependent oxidoreductase [Chloroflexi bacterium]|nr:LLM class flavin-dependent oxidoreductase [Chloroflexota bacterium]